MDYKVNETGKIVWYRLIGDSEVPTQVRLDMVLHIFWDCKLSFHIQIQISLRKNLSGIYMQPWHACMQLIIIIQILFACQQRACYKNQ